MWLSAGSHISKAVFPNVALGYLEEPAMAAGVNMHIPFYKVKKIEVKEWDKDER